MISNIILAIFIFISYTGCISNILKAPKPTFSDNIILPELPSPFSKISENIYPTWRNSISGHVISTVSECQNLNNDLKSAHLFYQNSVDNLSILQEDYLNLSLGRSYYKVSQGQVEGKPVKIYAYSFENNNCIFVSFLSGKPDNIEAAHVTLKNFIEKIKFKK